MDYSVFLKPELLIVVAVLVFIGLILKGTKRISDEFIPIILGILGIIFASLVLGGFSIEAVLQGIIAAACAVYGNQVTKQVSKINQTNDKKVDNIK